MVIVPLCEAGEGVLDELATLFHQEWSDFERWSTKEKIIVRLNERSTPESEEITLVAMESATVLATASIIHYELPGDPERRYWLGEVLTAPQQRGKGIAGALIRSLLEAAQAAKYPALWLYTPDQQALYHYLGWRRVEELWVEDEWVTVMVYELLPTADTKGRET